MGVSFRNTDKWWIDLSKDEELFEKIITDAINRIDTLDRIQVKVDEIKGVSSKDWQTLKTNLFSLKPNLKLRIYGGLDFDISLISKLLFLENISISVSRKIDGLNTFSKFKNLKQLSIKADSIESIDFLNSMEGLIQFSLAHNTKRSNNIDMTPISNLTNLTLLSIEGYDKNIHQIFENLKKLETIHLRSISAIKSLDFISHIQTIKNVIIQLGGIYQLKELEKLKNVQYLQLWRINKLEDISFISNMKNLQFLNLETLNKIEKFPSVENLNKLKRVLIASCKNMINFESLGESKSLVDFIYQNTNTQQPRDFLPVISNKNISNIGIGFQKVKDQKEIELLLAENQKKGMTHRYPTFKKEFVYE